MAAASWPGPGELARRWVVELLWQRESINENLNFEVHFQRGKRELVELTIY